MGGETTVPPQSGGMILIEDEDPNLDGVIDVTVTLVDVNVHNGACRFELVNGGPAWRCPPDRPCKLTGQVTITLNTGVVTTAGLTLSTPSGSSPPVDLVTVGGGAGSTATITLGHEIACGSEYPDRRDIILWYKDAAGNKVPFAIYYGYCSEC